MNDIQQEILHWVEDFQNLSSEPLYSRWYGSGPFKPLESAEETIDLQQTMEGEKGFYDSLIHYWVRSLFSHLEDRFEDHLFGPISRQCQCLPISLEEAEDRIAKLVKGFPELRAYRLPENIQQLLLMVDTPNFFALAGETDISYFSFFWNRQDELQ
jgi:hypothetical protein